MYVTICGWRFSSDQAFRFLFTRQGIIHGIRILRTCQSALCSTLLDYFNLTFLVNALSLPQNLFYKYNTRNFNSMPQISLILNLVFLLVAFSEAQLPQSPFCGAGPVLNALCNISYDDGCCYNTTTYSWGQC